MKQRTKNRVLIVAHRGASGTAPENTVVGFEKAMEYSIDQIETDCRVTKDGVVVLVHDAMLKNQTGHSLVVAESMYAQLVEHKPDLLTFDDAIALINKRVRIMVEIKDNVPVEPVLIVMRKYLKKGWKPEDFIFASFDYNILKEVYEQMPEVERVVLEVWSGVRAAWRARRLDTTYLSMDQGFLWWGFIWLASRKYKVFSYPYERAPFRLNHTRPTKWIAHGLHGIITDHPDLYAKKIS